MEFTRNLKQGASGEDVLYAKQRLVTLGYLYAATKKTFGMDTLKSVKAFQLASGLEADGIIGPLTWSALFPDEAIPTNIIVPAGYEVLDRFSDTIKNALLPELQATTDLRRAICLDAIQFAIDPLNAPTYPLSFYIRGGNLYNKTTGLLNVYSLKMLNVYFNKASYVQFYNNGREEMMRAAAEAAGYTIPGGDCSGQIVGLWIHNGVKKLGFDACANDIFNYQCTETTDPSPADVRWKPGHIGLYVGAEYTVEHIGGAYGCQITKNDRRVHCFTDGNTHKMSVWTAYGKPKAY